MASNAKNKALRHIIAGTAGHIDHGKTSLVRALTGTDTDRLAEEKRRGISIDLGFAHLQLGENIRLGLVDVPGHERFIKNMLAGAGGIDFVLFIIAADESIKPQTREHFEICRLLRIQTGIVVLTKSDLVDAELLDLVRMEAEEFVRGSFLESAPVVAVSAVTGAGLDQLKAEMTRLAASIAVKDASRFFRMPVDRAFTMKGFGSVVTGTLAAGSVQVEEEVELHPSRRIVRVRGIQVHGESVERAFAGQRTALNLAGVDVAGLARGMSLATAGALRPTRRIDTVFELLTGANPLKHGAPVHFHAGAAETEAEVRLLGDGAALDPGSRGYVRFLLDQPLLMLPGDRFIVRMFSPVVTIGGGEVLDFDPPLKLKRVAAAARARSLDGAGPAQRVAILARDFGNGIELNELIARTGLNEAELRAAADQLFHAGTWFAPRAFVEERLAAIEAALKAHHKQNPLAPGMSKEDLRSRELPGAPPFVLDAILNSTKRIVAEGEMVRLATHRVALKEDESAASAKIEAAFRDAGLAVPSLTETLSRSGVEPSRARSLLQLLLRERKLVKIGDDLVFHAEALHQLRSLLIPRKGQRFAVGDFKEWTGISRKYAIPLLEYLDRERITRRDGDSRIIL